jgi:hypothetical protein
MSRVGQIKAEQYINRWQMPIRINQLASATGGTRR